MKCNSDGTSVLTYDETLALITMIALLNRMAIIPSEWAGNLYAATAVIDPHRRGDAGNPDNFAPEK